VHHSVPHTCMNKLQLSVSRRSLTHTWPHLVSHPYTIPVMHQSPTHHSLIHYSLSQPLTGDLSIPCSIAYTREPAAGDS
jgi:hypothetical protein